MREMRRKDRQLDIADTLEIQKNGEYGVLATVTEDGKRKCNQMVMKLLIFSK